VTYRPRESSCTLSREPPYTSSTFTTVQSEAINGFFIRLVKSFYIRSAWPRERIDMVRAMQYPRYRSMIIQPASLRASFIFFSFHLSPPGEETRWHNLFSLRNDSFSLSLSLSPPSSPSLSSENFFDAAAATGNEFWSSFVHF